MRDGTFSFRTAAAVNHFGQAYGNVTEGQTKLEIRSNQDGEYNVLLIGTRKDIVATTNWKGVYGTD